MEQHAWTSARENLVSAQLLCTQLAVCFDLHLKKKIDDIKVSVRLENRLLCDVSLKSPGQLGQLCFEQEVRI